MQTANKRTNWTKVATQKQQDGFQIVLLINSIWHKNSIDAPNACVIAVWKLCKLN